MRKYVVGLVIILFFLVLIGAFLFKVFFTSKIDTATKEASVVPGATLPIASAEKAQYSDAFITACYQGYLEALASGDDQYPTDKFLTIKETCFSKEFIANWTLVAEETSLDPVILSQDVAQKSFQLVEVELLNKTSLSEEYSVVLGNGTTEQTVFVAVINESGKMKIGRVESVPLN